MNSGTLAELDLFVAFYDKADERPKRLLQRPHAGKVVESITLF